MRNFNIKNFIYEALAITGIIFGILFIINNYSILPDKIPYNYDASGQVLSYMYKNVILLVEAFTICFYLLFSIIGYNAKWSNYTVSLDENNSKNIKELNFRYLLIIKVETIWICTTGLFSMGNGIEKNKIFTLIWMLIIMLTVTLISFFRKIQTEIRKQSKDKKSNG